jgi:hypothetical protein
LQSLSAATESNSLLLDDPNNRDCLNRFPYHHTPARGLAISAQDIAVDIGDSAASKKGRLISHADGSGA